MQLIERIVYYFALPFIAIALSHTHRTRMIILCEGELLFLRGRLSNGRWILPGGGIHKNESSKDAVIREVYEETGIKIERSQIRKEPNNTHIKQGFISFSATFYLVNLPLKPKLSLQWYEIAEAKWVETKNISKIKMDKTEKRIVASLIEKAENGTIS